MNYKVETLENFRKEAKRLIKKYPSLKKELGNLGVVLSANPKSGTSLGHNCYKIRIAIASKGKGKSGGARIITHVYLSNSTVYLLSIFDKSEKDNISDKEIISLLNDIE